MTRIKVEKVLEVGAHHAEGPRWHQADGMLDWVDIMNGALHRYDPVTGRDIEIRVGQPLGAAAPRQRGGHVLAVESGFALLPAGGTVPQPIASVDSEDGRLRMNDGACDANGRFWAGTMAYDLSPKAAALYRLDATLRVSKVLGDVGISNGLDWSADARTMYYIDSLEGLDAFDFDVATGAISNRRRLVSIPNDPHSPAGATMADGMTLDAEGHLWIAIWGAGEVRRYSPAGLLEVIVEVPVACPTACCFGGDDLQDLYITTMVAESLRDEVGAGAIYRCRPGVRGVPCRTFAG